MPWTFYIYPAFIICITLFFKYLNITDKPNKKVSKSK